MEKSKERLEVLNRINEFEKEKKFDIDVENDLPAKPLEANEVDYLNKKLTSKINTKIANYIARKFIDKLIKNENMIIKEVLGLDNLSNLDTGFIITCNHFNPYDNFALHEVLKTYLKKTKKRFYKVIKEGNYSFKGLYGYFFRHCDTLPLSSNYNTITNVPIVPCFITMSDSTNYDKDGFKIQEYTVNFLKPIFPDTSLNLKDSSEKLSIQNYQMWKEVYEETYKIPLTYEE